MNQDRDWSPIELLIILQTPKTHINNNLAMLFGRSKNSLRCKKENFNYINSELQNPRKRKHSGLKNYSERDLQVYKYFYNLYIQ